jgi:hypothetical protein
MDEYNLRQIFFFLSLLLSFIVYHIFSKTPIFEDFTDKDAYLGEKLFMWILSYIVSMMISIIIIVLFSYV